MFKKYKEAVSSGCRNLFQKARCGETCCASVESQQEDFGTMWGPYLKEMIFNEALAEDVRTVASYMLARAEGVVARDSEAPKRVRMVQVSAHEGGDIECFETPDGVLEWHQNMQLCFAEHRGVAVEAAYYERARQRGVNVAERVLAGPQADWLPVMENA